jgi:hypothetical protein
LARLIRNRIARDRDRRDLAVGLGEEYPLLRLTTPDGRVERRFAPAVGGQTHCHLLEPEAIEAPIETHRLTSHGQCAQPDTLRRWGRCFRLRRLALARDFGR